MAGYRNLLIIKDKGCIKNFNEAHTTLDYWLRTCSNGEYTLSLTRTNKHRSISQNKLMWLWFNAIAQAWTDACGYAITPNDVHDAYCLLFIPKHTPKGNVAGSTSSLNTEQFTNFLNQIQADVQTEYGITLPNPEDHYFQLWAAQYE